MNLNDSQVLDLAEANLKRPSLTQTLYQQIQFLEMLGEKEVASKVRKAMLQVSRILDPIELEYTLILAGLKNRTLENF